MSLVRTVTRRRPAALIAALGAALLAAAARPAAAQGRVLFDYEGRVDREATIRVREDRIDVDGGGLFVPTRAGGVRVRSALPREEGTLRLRVADGRGDVDVVQQPSSSNGYTAVVRVRDPQPGADEYRLTAYWTPAGRGGWGDGTWDDRRDDRDGGWDERDDERERRRAERDRERRERVRERLERRREREERRRDRDGRDDRDDRGGWGWGGGSGGYGSGALRWSGRVDDVQEIRVRGRRAESVTVSGGGARDVRSRVDGGLPARDVRVRVTRSAGRGQVYVVEQPSERNDYTAVLRVVDRQGGAGHYDIEAEW